MKNATRDKTRPRDVRDIPPILRHEDIATATNLTAVQQHHEDVRRQFAECKLAYASRSRIAPSVRALAWWATYAGQNDMDRHTMPINPKIPVPLANVRCTALNIREFAKRTPGYYSGADMRATDTFEAKWVAEIQESRGLLHSNGDVVFGAAGPAGGDVPPFTTKVYDPEKAAIREQLVMRTAMPEQTEFMAPIGGMLRTIRNARHIDFVIDHAVVYRVAADAPVTIARDSGSVTKGQAMFRLDGPAVIGISELSRSCHNLIVTPRYPTLCASREHTMRTVDRNLAELCRVLQHQPAPALSLRQAMPSLVVGLSTATLDSLMCDLQQLTSKPAFQASLLDAVGPSGQFGMRSPLAGTVSIVEQDDSLFYKLQIGGELLRLPAICRDHLHVREGDGVDYDTLLADFGPRIVQDWAAFEGSAEPHLFWIAKKYVESMHTASVVYMPYAWFDHAVAYSDVMVDFADMARYADEATGWISLPLMSVAPGTHRLRREKLTVRFDATKMLKASH